MPLIEFAEHAVSQRPRREREQGSLRVRCQRVAFRADAVDRVRRCGASQAKDRPSPDEDLVAA